MDLGWKWLIPGSLALLLVVIGARVGYLWGLAALAGSVIAFLVLIRAVQMGQAQHEDELASELETT
jgi:hypothetical protein